MTDFSSVEHLERAFNNASAECFKFHEGLLEAYSQLKTLQSENQILQQRNEDLRAALADLNSTHNSVMADSFTKIDEIPYLRTTLAAQRLVVPVPSCHLFEVTSFRCQHISFPLQPHVQYSTTSFAVHHQRRITF